MTVTALFATAGATNAGLFPAPGLCEGLARRDSSRRDGRAWRPGLGRALVVTAAASDLLAVVFDLYAIASIGSAVALMVFLMVGPGTLGPLCAGGRPVVLLVALATTGITLLNVYYYTPLIHEPASIVTLLVILGMSVGLDQWWSRTRRGTVDPPPA